MLKIINAPLFHTVVERPASYKTYDYPVMTRIQSSPRVLKKVNAEEREKLEKEGIKFDKFYPVNYDILKIYQNEDDMNVCRMTSRREADDSLVIFSNDFPAFDSSYCVIAFPYNGIMKPMADPGMDYRVLKGTIIHSDKNSIKWQGGRYHKILYLVISPNVAIFDPSHKLHKDAIELKFEAVERIYNKGENGEEQSSDTDMYECMTVKITKGLKFSVEWTREDIPSVDMSVYKGVPVWTEYISESTKERLRLAKEGKEKKTKDPKFTRNTTAKAYPKQDVPQVVPPSADEARKNLKESFNRQVSTPYLKDTGKKKGAEDYTHFGVPHPDNLKDTANHSTPYIGGKRKPPKVSKHLGRGCTEPYIYDSESGQVSPKPKKQQEDVPDKSVMNAPKIGTKLEDMIKNALSGNDLPKSKRDSNSKRSKKNRR